MIGGISFGATSVTSGLDADKPANPKPGSQYLATDTKIVYVCYAAGVWVDTTNTTSGLDADKPANPRPGNQYLATDTKKQYNCYIAGIWSDNSKVSTGSLSARPPNPVVGDIYFTIDTKKQYNCYVAGNWTAVDDVEIVGVANTDKLAFIVNNKWSAYDYWQSALGITIPMTITKARVRIAWDAGYDGQARDIESKLLINNVQVGEVRYTNNDWATYYEDVTVYKGDKIVLWARYTDNLNPGGNVQNLRIYTELKYRHTLKTVGSGWLFDVDSV